MAAGGRTCQSIPVVETKWVEGRELKKSCFTIDTQMTSYLLGKTDRQTDLALGGTLSTLQFHTVNYFIYFCEYRCSVYFIFYIIIFKLICVRYISKKTKKKKFFLFVTEAESLLKNVLMLA